MAEIIAKLHDELVNAVNASDTRSRFKNLALEPRTSTPQAFRAFLAAETRRWAQVVRNAAFKVE